MPQKFYPVRDFQAQQAEWGWFLYVYCKQWKQALRYRNWLNPVTYKCETYSYKEEPQLGQVRRLYRLGRDLYKIPLSYQQFYDWFVHDKWFYGDKNDEYRARTHYYYRKGNRRPYRWSVCNWKGKYRQKRSYVRNESHKPKELSEQEQQRLDWREYKGFQRDQRKPHHRRRSTQIANEIARPHLRARQRNLLKKEKYDELYDEYDKFYWKGILWMLD